MKYKKKDRGYSLQKFLKNHDIHIYTYSWVVVNFCSFLIHKSNNSPMCSRMKNIEYYIIINLYLTYHQLWLQKRIHFIKQLYKEGEAYQHYDIWYTLLLQYIRNKQVKNMYNNLGNPLLDDNFLHIHKEEVTQIGNFLTYKYHSWFHFSR